MRVSAVGRLLLLLVLIAGMAVWSCKQRSFESQALAAEVTEVNESLNVGSNTTATKYRVCSAIKDYLELSDRAERQFNCQTLTFTTKTKWHDQDELTMLKVDVGPPPGFRSHVPRHSGLQRSSEKALVAQIRGQ